MVNRYSKSFSLLCLVAPKKFIHLIDCNQGYIHHADRFCTARQKSTLASFHIRISKSRIVLPLVHCNHVEDPECVDVTETPERDNLEDPSPPLSFWILFDVLEYASSIALSKGVSSS